jgi:hypothetical protein
MKSVILKSLFCKLSMNDNFVASWEGDIKGLEVYIFDWLEVFA